MKIRTIQNSDLDTIARYERDISIISFSDEAITDLNFHKSKLEKAIPKEKDGMLVLEIDSKPVGWLWMTPRINSVSNEKYVNFKSFYIDEAYRGTDNADKLMEAGMGFCKRENVTRVVGKVHVGNLPMRALYKNHGFQPTHLTMEITLK